MTKHKSRGIQFAALPWRLSEGGTRQIMLLTSRETCRWVIPRGWPVKGRKPADVAKQEAYEEAGLVGHIVGKRPIGDFHYASGWPNEKSSARSGSFCSGLNNSLMNGRRRAEEKPDGLMRKKQLV